MQISAETLEATIESIARLKITIDLDNVSGESQRTSMARSLRSDYIQKLEELERALSNQMTKAELYKKIAQKIAALQKGDNEAALVEKEKRQGAVRQNEKPKPILTAPAYKLVGGKNIPPKSHAREGYKFIPAINAILVTRYNTDSVRSLKLMNLKTLKEETLEESCNGFHLSPDRNQIYIFIGDKLKIVDFTNSSKNSEVTLVPKPGTYIGNLLDFSPSGNLMAAKYADINLGYRDFLQVFDLRSGEVVLTADVHGKVDGGFPSPNFKFVNEELMVTTKFDKSGSKVVLLDLTTGDVAESLPIPKSNETRVKISEDRTKVFIIRADDPNSPVTVEVMDLTKKGNAITSKKSLPPNLNIPAILNIPQHPNHIALLGNSFQFNHASIIEAKTGEIVFDFESKYMGIIDKSRRVIDLDLSPDGTVLVYSQNAGLPAGQQYRIDVWKKIEDKK
ncbi:hypothetical protein D3C87_1296660 [compost metagenome]